MSDRLIYIDVDDVISDTTITFPSLLDQHFGKTVSFEAITSFDLGVSFDLDKEELARFMHIAHSPDVITAYQPRIGAIESIHTFISMGYEIAIVTGRPPSAKQLTEEWLAKHKISFHYLFFVDKYSRILPDARPDSAISLEDLSKISFCFAVEDSGDMARFLSHDMQIPVALMDRPWNRNNHLEDTQSFNLVNRCHDWDEVMEVFQINKQNN